MRCANIPHANATFSFGFDVFHSGTLHCHCDKYVYLTVMCLFISSKLETQIYTPSPHPLPDNQGYLHGFDDLSVTMFHES